MNEVKFGVNRFCGPAVLSVLTGKSTDETASLLCQITGRSNITSVELPALNKALDICGFDVEEIIKDNTLFGLFHEIYNQPGMYLVFFSSHVVTIEVTEDQKIFFCDNHTREPIHAGNSARLGQRVVCYWGVKKRPEPVELGTEYSCSLTKNSDNVSYYVEMKQITHWSAKMDTIARTSFYLRNSEALVALAETLAKEVDKGF